MRPEKSRKRKLQIKLNRLGYEELTNLSAPALDRLSSLKRLAVAFPTSRSLAVRDMNSEDFFRVNFNYWSRIGRGERTLKDAGLLLRIGLFAPEIKELFDSKFCKILTNPLGNSREFNSQLKKVIPIFENLLFRKDENHKFIQRERFWGARTSHLMVNIDFLAYQLILFRMTAIKEIDTHPYLSIKRSTLLLLRVLMTTPLRKIAHAILLEYYYFFVANAQGLDLKIPNVSVQQLENNPLPSVIELCLPEAKGLPYMQSFLAYSTYHDELLTKARTIMFGDSQANCGAKDILYWADYYCDLWLSGSSEKISLFDLENPTFIYIYRAIQYSKGLHRIW